MHNTSFKRIAFLSFSGPVVIILGAIVSIAIGRGQVVMLPSTVAALIFYGAVIAVGAAWHDGTPHLLESKSKYVAVFGVVTLALGATIWLTATHGVAGLLWRPVLTVAVCLWLGVVVASVIPQRALA
jgi:hypothetical protein